MGICGSKTAIGPSEDAGPRPLSLQDFLIWSELGRGGFGVVVGGVLGGTNDLNATYNLLVRALQMDSTSPKNTSFHSLWDSQNNMSTQLNTSYGDFIVRETVVSDAAAADGTGGDGIDRRISMNAEAEVVTTEGTAVPQGPPKFGFIQPKFNATTTKPRLVAIKVIARSVLERHGEKSVKMIDQERTLLASLFSPHIVNLHHTFTTPAAICMVGDYCRGGDLYGLMKKFEGGIIPENYARFYAASVVLGLEYLHSERIVHRDIKPGKSFLHSYIEGKGALVECLSHCSLPSTENILVEETGFVRLTDFGVSERMHSNGFVYSTSGTPPYMAPECFSLNHEHGPCADYFAFGIVLFQILVGCRPCKVCSVAVRPPPDNIPLFLFVFSFFLALAVLLQSDLRQ